MKEKGLIERAEDGTLFLDEIGDLNIESQVKLLRLLQEDNSIQLGSDIAKLSNARIIVATNRSIKSLQSSNTFREDLYYRLRSHHINIPPLRERKKDIPYLIDFFLIRAAKELGKTKPRPPKELYTLLSNYHFPGNIRELEGIIYDAVSLHKSGILSLESIRSKLSDQVPQKSTIEKTGNENDDSPILITGRFPSIKESETALIKEALKRAEGNQTIAADLLGISRRALNNRLQRKKDSN
ncbi:MAG: sigma 54-interacting transcriptional regulator [Melioribacteraceae bacterium]|nr:sigma 54-interacting transcriptional regulator [Melioribacteraceae bacterium]